MFSTFRKKLRFWFFVFISSGLIIVALSIAYLQQREKITRSTELIDSAYANLLQKVVVLQNFLSYDTKNEDFFRSGKSRFMVRSEALSDSILLETNRARILLSSRAQEIAGQMEVLERSVAGIDSLAALMVEKLRERGYKDFMLEGEMRTHAHWLEGIREIPVELILSLRRHEKDYIIRNEGRYVDKLNSLIGTIRGDLRSRGQIPAARKDSILWHLELYGEKFNQLVMLDSQIGMKDNTGLKLEMDERVSDLEQRFSELIFEAKKRKSILFLRLNTYFLLLTVGLVLASLWLSQTISRKITKPLTELTSYINRFVDSNFMLDAENPKASTQDEIGLLTENFSILKDEITSRLKFFKEKVEERTAELASVNRRLQHINEANSRFVPTEFIHFLGKKSIEEVRLGDQIQQEMTILFTDIRSFTMISESLTPQENFDFINDWLSGIVPVIQRNRGIIDKYIGDTVMALFPDGPEWAIKAALEFEEALGRFNARQQYHQKDPVRIGTGVHTGQLILGTIGHKERLDTTVISDAVNIASRVEGLTKFYDAAVIATEETLKLLKEPHPFHYRFLDFVKVKGKTKTLSVFEVIAPTDTRKLGYLDDYDEAVRLMRSRKIAEASRLFEDIYRRNPGDGTVKIILDRCRQYLQHGLPDDWDGVEEMEEK